MDFPCSSVGKECACSAGDLGSVPGSGRSTGEGNGNPLQYSCLENSMDRGAWQATINGVSKVRHNLATKPPPMTNEGFPGGASGKVSSCQCRRHETRVRSLGRENSLQDSTPTHSSILAWRILWTEEASCYSP